MSFGNGSGRNISSRRLSSRPVVVGPWVRNPSWLPMPTVGDSESKFVGLHQIDRDSNFIRVLVAGAYTVDWGDGSAPQNFSSATFAEKQYDYNTAALNGTDAPVTFSTNSNLVTRNNHGYSNGMQVEFYNISGSPGIAEGESFYVVNATTNTFQISSTVGGSALPIGDGTGTLLPYKQVIVTITPQSGQLFSSVELNHKHNQSNLQKYDSGFLDVIFNRVMSAVTIGSTSPTSSSQNIEFNKLQRAQLLNCGFSNAGYLFNGCSNLRSVNISMLGGNSLTNTNYMFSSCTSLTTVPLFNTASVTNMSGMFSSCTSLTTVPLFNTAAVTDMNRMFQDCYSLTTVPLFNTAAVTDMSRMFSGCYSLTTVPLFNTASVQNMNFMFALCYSLTTVPLFNTASVTNMASMFSSCTLLTTVPLFNTASVTTMSNMFTTCRSLTSVPLFNTASVTNMASMLNGCNVLTTVPLFNTSAVTDMSTMLSQTRVTTVPLFNTASVQNMNFMFNSCTSLTTVPLFNTASVQIMSAMFYGCSALTTVPHFNTNSVYTMANMFNFCDSLVSIPQLNMSGITLASGLNNFTGSASCPSLIRSDVSGTKVSVSYQGCKLSQNGLENIMNLLEKGTAQSLTISSNWGAPSPVSTNSTHTINSKSVTVSSATGLAIGMQITGAGSALTNPVPYIWAGDQGWIRRGALGAPNYLQNDDIISFSSWTNGPSTGITTDVPYYVVLTGLNPNFANAFRVSSTPGGTPISWSNATAGSAVNIRYNRKITAISGTTITTDREWMGTNITNSSTYRLLPTATALHKGWIVTG